MISMEWGKWLCELSGKGEKKVEYLRVFLKSLDKVKERKNGISKDFLPKNQPTKQNQTKKKKKEQTSYLYFAISNISPHCFHLI